ncbi:hypothetical protein LPJ56_002019 [Coemansia sp. RSA 2599]|nr:hypothetical protein LPJ56_002019 [Coemansia sp. RSA 2599]
MHQSIADTQLLNAGPTDHFAPLATTAVADTSPAASRPTSRRASKRLSKKKQQQRRRSNSLRSQNAPPPAAPSPTSPVSSKADALALPAAKSSEAATSSEPTTTSHASASIAGDRGAQAAADAVAQLAVLAEEEPEDGIGTQASLAPGEIDGSSLQAMSLVGDHAEADASAYAERCSMHPGTRNDLWCENCEAAICEHCGKPGAHHDGHQVMKLSMAYDDTFESIEEVQLQLMSYLSETRVRSTLLDSTLGAVSESYERTQRLIELHKESAMDELEQVYRRTEQTLAELIDGCIGWRQHVEESVELAQKMAEEFTPAQAVAQRGLFFRVLAFATDSRPDFWDQGVPEHRDYSTLVLPATMVDTLVVPSVLDLGRKRGHVRVTGEPFSAHGSVWKLEVRRTRNRTGDPMLTVSVSCIERGGSSAVRYTLGVGLAGDAAGDSVFAQTRCDEWGLGSSYDFALCSLDELQSAGVLAESGCVTVRLTVDIAGYKMLSEAQEDRIRVLEQRIKDLELQSNSQQQQQQNRVRGGSGGDSDAGPAAATGSLRPDRRKRSDSRGWATSPRVASRRQEFLAGSNSSAHTRVKSLVLPPHDLPPLPTHASFSGSGSSGSVTSASATSTLPSCSCSGQGQVENAEARDEEPQNQAHDQNRSQDQAQDQLESPVQRLLGQLVANDVDLDGGLGTAGDGAAPDTLSSKKKPEHRRAASLTTKLRRAPPIPFNLNLRAYSVQSQAPSLCGSEMNESQGSLGDERSSVLRRLSGWMKSTEDRVAKQAKRVRQLAANGGRVGVNSDEDLQVWTFLDKSMSPGFPAGSTQSLNVLVTDSGSPLSMRNRERRRPASYGIPGNNRLAPPPPPTAPLPPIPIPIPIPIPELRPSIADDDGVAQTDAAGDDGFAFDGIADIEREQAEVDARMQMRRHTDASVAHKADIGAGDMALAVARPASQADFDHESQLIARKQSVVQRLDALMLIQNTAENSRDGYSQSTLRRISSELGMVMEGRRRRIEEARAHELGLAGRASRRADTVSSCSPAAAARKSVAEASGHAEEKDEGSGGHGRRTVSMDPSEIRRAITRAGVAGSVGADEDGLALPPLPALPASRGERPGSCGSLEALNSDYYSASASMESVMRTPTRDSLLPQSRRVSSASAASSSSSIGRSPARITRPSGGVAAGAGAAARRDSFTDHGQKISAVLGRGSQQSGGPASLARAGVVVGQLTPQANRRGGILKAGRTKREVPGRMHGLADVCALPELPVARTPVAQGRYTEYGADAAAYPAGNGESPVTKSGRSSTLPSLEQQQQQQQQLGGGRRADVVPGRQVRSARAARKKVRFPEEIKLLETIRLIDPHIARSIEGKAGPAYRSSSPPPLVKPGSKYVEDSDESDREVRGGLAARVRSSPRLSPRSSIESQSRKSICVSSDSRSATNNSSISSSSTYQRPPLPRINSSSSSGAAQQKLLLASHLQAEDYCSGDELVQGRASDAHTLDIPLLNEVCADSSSAKELVVRQAKINWRGLHVGPNTSSAQSSPVAAGVVVTSSNISSPSPGSEVDGADRTVFGAEQIPSIARGRNTAFKQPS